MTTASSWGGGSGDQVGGNWVEANSGAGIFIGFGSTDAVVSQNKALSNTETGILVTGGGIAQLSSNVANGNTRDGINTTTAGLATSLTGNRASFNRGLGINATAGQQDGGSNVVQHNTNSLQCRNVVCAEVSS